MAVELHAFLNWALRGCRYGLLW